MDKLIASRVGALFAEMGTGKTRMAIEFVRLRQERIARVVWFCPVSLKTTIYQEILNHTDTPVDQICLFDDKTYVGEPIAAFWYIIGTESMSSSNRVVLSASHLINDKTFVVVDESGYIKGYSAIRTRRITLLSENARYRMILTGTPISQGVVDLYSQMKFLSPKILGYRSFYSFARNHLEYSEKYPGKIVRALNTEQLAAKIQPYVYQITKDECLDLPSKTFERFYFELSEKQAEAYLQAKQEILDTSLDEWSGYVILRLFTVLQQITSGFWNRQGETLIFPNARLNLLEGALNDIPEDEKVIIWCRFRYSVTTITEQLARLCGGASISEYHGGLSEEQRNSQIERFKRAGRFLVATQQSGGHGLTLTEARYAIFYENGFKYADRIQAEDRIHRIGQARTTIYIDLISQTGIEQRIQKALSKKRNAIADFRQEIEAVKNRGDKLGQLVEAL